MPRKLKCPVCENIEYYGKGRGIKDNFELRGKFKGRAVIKCLKCNAGLLMSFFAVFFWAKPTVIPADTWKLMEKSWARRFSSQD